MKFIEWVLRMLIKRERKRQIEYYGYTAEHDDTQLEKDPYHLIEEAAVHYNWGHPIQALALLQAQKDWGRRMMNNF